MAGYAGIGGTARKLKRAYIGVEGIARKIKRMYIGVEGVARLWYKTKGTLTYQGSAPPLSSSRLNLSAANTASHVLFAGGASTASDGTARNIVNAYDSSLTMTTATTLAKARELLAGTSLAGKAFFAGGTTYSSGSEAYSVQSTVDVYDDSLTRQSPTALSVARDSLGGASVGDYALFGGGYGSGYSAVVDSYNSSLTRSTATALSAARDALVGVTHKNHALFAGGVISSSLVSAGYSDAVDAYNSSLTRSTPTAMSKEAGYPSATRVGNYVIFAGGYVSAGIGRATYLDFANAYDESLTRTVLTNLSAARRFMGAAATENYALFAGGLGSDTYSAVDVYDDQLTRTTGTSLGAVKIRCAGGSIGDYALFAGGSKTSTGTAQTTVYAYKEV